MSQNVHDQLKSLALFLSEYATTLLASGVHTSRVVRNSSRIAASFGFQVFITMFQRTIILTIRTTDGDHSYSMVSAVKHLPISFEVNSDLSALSWEAYDNHLTLPELWEKFHQLMAKPHINQWLLLLLVSIGNAAFCRLFGGDLIACVGVCCATAIGFRLRQLLLKQHLNHYFVWFLSALTAALSVTPLVLLDWGATPEIAMATSVLYLVPGVPLINGIIDIIEGHVLAGVSRTINALLLIVCLSLGLLCALLLIGGNVL